MAEALPPTDPSWNPTNPVNLSIAEECLGTFKWLRSAWGGDHEAEAMRRAMEHALEGWEPPPSTLPVYPSEEAPDDRA